MEIFCQSKRTEAEHEAVLLQELILVVKT